MKHQPLVTPIDPCMVARDYRTLLAQLPDVIHLLKNGVPPTEKVTAYSQMELRKREIDSNSLRWRSGRQYEERQSGPYQELFTLESQAAAKFTEAQEAYRQFLIGHHGGSPDAAKAESPPE